LEQGIWNSKVSDLYYENDDKKRFNAGDGGAGGGAIPDYSFQAEVFYLVDPKTNAPMVNFIFWVNDDHGSKSAFSFPVDRIPLGHGLGRDGAGGLTTLVLKPERRTKLDFHPFAGASFNQRGSMGGKVTLRQYKGSENEEETWIFIRSGGVEDLELEVEAVGYDNWIPKGGKDETSAGNQITISAKLKTKDGKPLREKAKIIKFELSQVSQEPGVCLNWPPKASAPGHVKDLKDLQFDDKKNSKLEIKGPRKQTAETPDGEYAEAEAVISCYDYGAWGTIKVVAEMANGTPVVGYLKGHPNQKEILLPKRKATSKIADAWKALPENDAVALADDDDNENSPEGDKHRGDGLTLYEEYRGFLVNGKHVCGNPHLKEPCKASSCLRMYLG
jgi:hypothetical protein